MIYIIEEVRGGGLKRYVSDLKKYFNIVNISNSNDLKIIDDTDILLVQNLYFTDIDISDLLKIKNVIITIHDYYWIHEFVMRNFFNDNYPPVHTNYLRNVEVNPEIIKLFNHCKYIIHSTNFTYSHYEKYFDKKNFIIIPHIDYKINLNNFVIPKIQNVINIGILHSLTKAKGEDLIKYLLNITEYKNYKINYLITGKNIFYTEDDNLYDIINKYNIHGTTLLNIWGETYCYALTKILNTGIPIIYNNIGSFKERIPKKDNYFICYENENTTDLNILNETFYKFLDYIIENNGINIYDKTNEIINTYEKYLME